MRSVLWISVLATCVIAEMAMDNPGPEALGQKIQLHEHWKSKTFHWLVSLLMLVIVPSVSSVYSIANKHDISLMFQIGSSLYAVLELFLNFNGPNDHENIVSKAIAWIISVFYIFMIFNGFISYGKLSFDEKLRTTKWRYLLLPFNILTYKIMTVFAVFLGFFKSAVNVVSMLGFCFESHTGQCNAHGIMGMAFIIYGFLLSLVLVIPWIRKSNYSQEFYDSIVITIWGIINTFTEHRPWEPWSHGDYQHTSMGIIFWCCGMLGVYLSLNKKRNFVPALTLILTGYAMSEHAQHLIISTKVHGFFGNVLMIGGLCRIIEISFLLDDKSNAGEIKSFQYLPPFALILAGLLFMSANEEQLKLVVNLGADHSSYILVICSAACLIQLWALMLLNLYLRVCNNDYSELSEDIEMESPHDEDDFSI